MSRVSAETPTSAQQNAAGTDSTNATGGGVATVTGAVRITPAGGVGVGWMLPSLTVAFIGESEAAPIRAVSLRATVTPGR